MPWTERIDPRDDLFHPRNDDPYWNESTFVTFYAPERRLSGVIYFFFRPNMKMVNWGPMIWDPTGQEMYNCRHFALDEYMAMPDGCEMYDYDLPNGLSMRTIELQQSYRHLYDGPGCSFELRWDGVMPPHYMREEDVVPSNMRDWVAGLGEDIVLGHYQQCGRMRGTLTLAGEDIAIDSPSIRDHSWGPRPVRSNMPKGRGTFPWAMNADGSAFNLYSTTNVPLEDDPVLGTTERVTSGFYWKDGQMGELESGSTHTDRDAEGRPLALTINAVDSLGRKLEAEGEFVNRLNWVGGLGDYLVHWCQARWSLDGDRDAIGDSWDYMAYAHFRNFHRARLAAAR
jgi:hypothetical protein